MKLNREQLATISRYFSDFSKIIVGSVVIGFFVPTQTLIPLQTFAAGLSIAIASVVISVRVLR